MTTFKHVRLAGMVLSVAPVSSGFMLRRNRRGIAI